MHKSTGLCSLNNFAYRALFAICIKCNLFGIKYDVMKMDIQSKLKQWIKDQLAERGHGAQTALAAHLGLHPSAVNRMLNVYQNKKTRDITIEELLKISDFFNQPPPVFYSKEDVDVDFMKTCAALDPLDKQAVLDFLDLLKKVQNKR